MCFYKLCVYLKPNHGLNVLTLGHTVENASWLNVMVITCLVSMCWWNESSAECQPFRQRQGLLCSCLSASFHLCQVQLDGHQSFITHYKQVIVV